MTAPHTVTGQKLLVQIGDGASPETFAHDCMINTERGISISADTNEYVIGDCDSPDDMAWKEVTKDGAQVTIQGAGMMHSTSWKSTWYDWAVSPDSKTCRINLNIGAEFGGGYLQGEFHLTQFEITGNRGDKITASMTLVSSGALDWTAAS